jgi:hypothetical protein
VPVITGADASTKRRWKGGEMRAVRDSRFRFVPWSVLALAWIGSVIVEQVLFGNSVGCELSPGGSVFGEAGWSGFPLGRTCTWLVDGATVVDRPALIELLIPVTLMVWLVTLLRAPSAPRVSA